MTRSKRVSQVTVVNDYPDFLKLMADLLSDEGYEVSTIPRHQDAFDQIKTTKPDLVICDLIFGGEPLGFSLIDMLRLDPATKDLPIILCSAATEKVREVEPSLSAKGIQWLEKPFTIDALLELVKNIEVEL